MSNDTPVSSPITTTPQGLSYTIKTTTPDQLLRHDISDEELDMLCDTQNDSIWQAMWASLGLSFGGLPSAIPIASSYIEGQQALEPSDFIQIILLSIALVSTIIFWVIAHGRRKRSSDLKTKIRNRAA